MAPKNLRHKHPYQLSVTTLGFDGFTKLHLEIEGSTESGETISVEKDVLLKNNQAQLVELDVCMVA